MIKAVLLLPLVLGLGACASQIGYHTGKLAAANEQLGQAVQQNIAAQTVNPQGSTEALVADGARTAVAVNRYKTDKVEKPASAATLSMSSSSADN
jgi:type IV pilus biogenesis protein CpaD/CtpE